MGISIRAYARQRGVSDAAVRKAIAAGRIKLQPDGTIDPNKADQQWAKNTNPARESRQKAKKPRPKRPASDGVRAVQDTLKESGLRAELGAAGSPSFNQARTAHEIAKAQLARIQLQEKRGEVINKSKTTAQIFRLAREIRDAWLNWPSRISAEMAAELNIDEHKLHTALEKYVRNHLSELGEPKPPKLG